MSFIKNILQKVKKTLRRGSKKGKKKGPGFVTRAAPKSTTVSTMLASTISVTMTTVDYSSTDYVTNITTVMATVGKARLSGETELLSLTEIMAIVSGVVGLIILSTLVCFVYRTKCRNEVRMRKTGVGERRSGAMSLDLMELYENDPNGRHTTRDRLLPAFNSPMYGRREEHGETISSKPNSRTRELSDGNTEDGGYYSVALNDSNELCVSETNGHYEDNHTDNLSGRNLESFKGKKVENTHGKLELNKDTSSKSNSQKSKHTYENVNNDINIACHKETCKKDTSDRKEKKHLYENVYADEGEPSSDMKDTDKVTMMDDVLENFHEVESIDLSSPPTPCSHGSYVNVSTDDDKTELDAVKHGYINTDFREQSMPLLEQIEEKDNSKRNKDHRKNRQKSTEKQFSTTNTASPSIPIEDEEGNDYLPMNSPTMTDIDYVPMDIGESDDELIADNVYIYMETDSPNVEYINYQTSVRNYENV